MLSRRALDLKPPTGFVRDLVVEAKGEHAGRLDIKHGGITIVTNLARTWAVRAGITQKERWPAWMPPHTPRRTRSTPTSRGNSPRRSTSSGRSGSGIKPSRWQRARSPDDYIDPASLGPFSRSGLKEAFRVIARAQRLLSSEEGIRPS